jgi:hypothetical protein
MASVLSLVTFDVDAKYRDEFLRRAEQELKPYWEAHGSDRYEVYEEMGPTGPTGRLVELNVLADRAAYARMSEHVRTAKDVPARAYGLVQPTQFQVLEWRA